MARVKKKKYKVTYAIENRDSLLVQGYKPWELRRTRRIIKTFSDEQAIALACLQRPNTRPPYVVESIVEVYERAVSI